MNKKLLIIAISTIIIIPIGIFTFLQTRSAAPAVNQLSLPPLIDTKDLDGEIEISIQNGEHEFFPGVKSSTKGYNQNYLGPAIKLYEGQETQISFTNNTEDPTSVHGHGLHVPGIIDGGPQSVIMPNETWNITLPVQQEASTNWFHPHLHGTTAEQVHTGLAGLYLIEDENSQDLPIPKDYGVDDIPLIVQDRNFEDGKMENYSVTMEEIMNGKREDTLVINGTVDPFVEVPKGWVRLRLLNGSNARYYDFHLENNESFYKIATEGGFLESPVEVTSLKMTPGERNEIMINMSDGETRNLMAEFLPLDDDENFLSSIFPTNERVVEIRVDSNSQNSAELPDTLNEIEWLNADDTVVTRTFELQMEHDMENHSDSEDSHSNEADHSHEDDANTHSHEMNMNHDHTDPLHSLFKINGKAMDINRIDERVKKGDVEIWRITADEMDHPFHMHGASFQILSQNGRPPAPEDMGWKDTVDVGWGWTEIIVRFDYEATEEYPYMYHCHILEHEDGGMMGQFTVE